MLALLTSKDHLIQERKVSPERKDAKEFKTVALLPPPATEGDIMRRKRDTRRIAGPLASHSTLQPPVHQGSQITLLFLLHNPVILGFFPFLTSHYKVVRQVYAQLQVKNAENHCYAASSLADYTLMHLFLIQFVIIKCGC